MPDEQVITPQAPETPAAPSLDQRIGALKGEARDHWQLHGDIAGAEKLNGTRSEATASTETPGAPAEADAAQTETASGTVKEQPRTRGDRDFRGLRTKLSETEKELIAARAKLEVLEKQGKPADSRPSAPAPETPQPQAVERPAFPNIADFKTVEDYQKAVKDWHVSDAKWVQSQVDGAIARQKQEAAAEQQRTFKTQQVEQGRKEYKDFDAVAFNPKIPASDVLLAALDKRTDGYKLRYWLGTHPTEAAELAQATHINGLAELYRKDPASAMYMVGRAEAFAEGEFKRIIASLSKPAAESTTTRRLPRPTTEAAVVPRGTMVEDELTEAVKRGDQEAYSRIQNKRDAEKFRSGQY